MKPKSCAGTGRSERLPQLDFLRFLAAGAVAAYHWTYLPSDASGVASKQAFGLIQNVTQYGYLGVDLFFLISGFVIFWSASNRSSLSFLASRISRLYPTFWCCALITIVALSVTQRLPDSLTVRSVLINFTMLPGLFSEPYIDGVYWTLFVEFKFYALVLAIMAFAPPRYVESVIKGWLVASVLTFGAVYAGMEGAAIYFMKSASIYPFSPLFIAGAINFMIWKEGLSSGRMVALSVCLALAMINAQQIAPKFMTDPTSVMTFKAAGIVCLFFLGLFSLALKLWRMPPTFILARMGAATYPLYLLHNQIGKSIWIMTPEWLGDFPRLAVIISIVGCLTYLVTITAERRLAPWLNRQLHKFLVRREPS